AVQKRTVPIPAWDSSDRIWARCRCGMTRDRGGCRRWPDPGAATMGITPAAVRTEGANMKTTPARILATIAVVGVALIACDDRTDRTVGQKIDSALARTQEKLASAGNKIAQQTDKAVESVKKSGDGASTTGVAKPVSDTAITASIKTDLLKDPDLSVL